MLLIDEDHKTKAFVTPPDAEAIRNVATSVDTPTTPPPQPSLNILEAEIKSLLADEWMPQIYRTRVLVLRTRAHRIGEAAKNSSIEIQHTLLGVELKIGHKRALCPDLATARYLAIFARLGCVEVAVPYDITGISRLADELESAWHRMLLLIAHLTEERHRAFRSRLSKTLVVAARDEINNLGPGSIVPQFNQNTKQRPTDTKKTIPRNAA